MNIRVSENFILKIIRDDLVSVLGRLGGFSHIEVLHDHKVIADATTKILIYNKDHEKVAFLLCGYSKNGDISRRNLNNTLEFKAKLEKKSGSVLLEPLLSGHIEGIEYSVWPYCMPLGEKLGFVRRKVQLFQMRPRVLEWLKNITKESLSSASQKEVLEDFIFPLQQLAANDNVRLSIKEEIKWQVSCLEDKTWIPHFVLAHNDLWVGNVLINKNNLGNDYKGIAIIDWAGGMYRSFAIYDLVRISMSMNISRAAFHKELLAHCSILKCDKKNTKGYLLASFAYLANNLGAFPEERFIKLLDNCFNFLSEKI